MNYIIDGVANGFDTMVSDLNLSTLECRNLLSARQKPDAVAALLQKEIDNNFVLGPFDKPPFHNYRVSPIGVAVGKYSLKERLILDLSAPRDSIDHESINNLIDKNLCSLTYVTIDDAVRAILDAGRGARMCHVDIKSAFKILSIRPDQWHLFLMKWCDKYYVPTTLVFGCRSSPVIFSEFAKAICYILETNYGIARLQNLLDDFLSIDDPDYDAERTMALFTLVFSILGIPLAEEKSQGPTTVILYLGLILDSLKLEIRLPEDKLQRIIDYIRHFLALDKCTKRDLLQLLGHMAFSSRAVRPARTFTRHLINMSCTVNRLHETVYIDASCREDLRMWLYFLENWNGVTMFYEPTYTTVNDLNASTDSSSTYGFGGYCQNRWFSGKWSDYTLPKLEKESLSMAFRELYPIVVAAMLFGATWAKKRIVFYCDNQSTCYIVNSGRSTCNDIMKLMRTLTYVSCLHNFLVVARFIEGKNNPISDALSRGYFQVFKTLTANLEMNATPEQPLPDPLQVLWH